MVIRLNLSIVQSDLIYFFSQSVTKVLIKIKCFVNELPQCLSIDWKRFKLYLLHTLSLEIRYLGVCTVTSHRQFKGNFIFFYSLLFCTKEYSQSTTFIKCIKSI